MKKNTLFLNLLGVALLSATTGANAENANSAPKGTLVYCSEGSPAGFDAPQFTAGTDFEATSATIYNGLVQFARGGTQVIPGLATSWDVSADGKVWTFHLRKGVKFHTTSYFTPTRDFNADDVLATFNRQLHKDDAFRKAYPTEFPYFNDMELSKNLKSLEKLDDYTVKFTLNNVDAAFIQNLALPSSIVESGEYMANLLKAGKAPQINQQPIGTGPFVFVRYQKDAQIRYKANPTYWDKTDGPKVANLVFAITKDPSVRMQKLKTNECQVMAYPQPADLPELRANKNLKVMSEPGFNVGFVYYNTEKKPFDNPKVRIALDRAINKKEIVKAVYGGEGKLAINPMPETQWSYNKDIKPYTFDPVAAKKLLAEAGYPDGFETTLWTLPVSRPYNPNGRLMGEMVQADWKKIGVKVKLQTYEWGEYLKRAQQGEHSTIMVGWTGDNGDPDNWLSVLFSCSAIGGSNYSRFCQKPFEELLQKAKLTTNQAERTKYYEKAQVLFHEQLPGSPIASSVNSVPMRSNVEGFKMNAFGVNQFYGVGLK